MAAVRGQVLPRGALGRLGGVLTFGFGPFGVALTLIGATQHESWLIVFGIAFLVLASLSAAWSIRIDGDHLGAGPFGVAVRRWQLEDVIDVRLGALPVRGYPACVEVVTERWTAKLWSSYGVFDDRREEWLAAISAAAGLDGPGEDRRRVRNDAYSTFYTLVSFAPILAAVGVIVIVSGGPGLGLLIVGLAVGVAAWNVALLQVRRQRERASSRAIGPIERPPVYVARFAFDAGSGSCLWAGNDSARARFGVAIDHHRLAIEATLITEIDRVLAEYDTSIDWSDPAGPSPWSSAREAEFDRRADALVGRLRAALAPLWTISDARRGKAGV